MIWSENGLDHLALWLMSGTYFMNPLTVLHFMLMQFDGDLFIFWVYLSFICNVELNACFSCLYARVRIMLIRSTIAFLNLFCNLGCLVLMLCDSNLMSDETLACQIDIFTLLCIRSVLDHYKCIFTCIIKDLATIKDVFHLQKVFL